MQTIFVMPSCCMSHTPFPTINGKFHVNVKDRGTESWIRQKKIQRSPAGNWTRIFPALCFFFLFLLIQLLVLLSLSVKGWEMLIRNDPTRASFRLDCFCFFIFLEDILKNKLKDVVQNDKHSWETWSQENKKRGRGEWNVTRAVVSWRSPYKKYKT